MAPKRNKKHEKADAPDKKIIELAKKTPAKRKKAATEATPKKTRKKQTRLSFSSKCASPTSADAENGSELSVKDKAKANQADTEEAARSKLVGLLMRTFSKACSRAELPRCRCIETALFALTSSMGSAGWREYRLRARSIIFNLRAADGALLRRVLDDEVSPEELVRLKADDLACESLKAERIKEREKYFKSAVHMTQRVPKSKFEMYRQARAHENVTEPPSQKARTEPHATESSDVPVASTLVSLEQDAERSGCRHADANHCDAVPIAEEADDDHDEISDNESSDDSSSDSSCEVDICVSSDRESSGTAEPLQTPVHLPPSTRGDEALAQALDEMSSSASSSSSSAPSEASQAAEAMGSQPDDAKLAMLVTMGFGHEHARAALQQTGGNVSRAALRLCEQQH